MTNEYMMVSLFAYEELILLTGTLAEKVCVDVNRKYRKLFQIKQ